MLRTEAIKNLLLNITHADLANLYHLYMEVQVNIAQDNGTRTEGEYQGVHWHGWTDGNETWKSFRIPYNAATKPEYTDRDINFNLALHTEAIGLTGWDWYNKQSRWVAFDFDSIISHKQGLTTQQLLDIQEQALKIPYLSVRKSTSGNGLHFYIFLNEPVYTVNHNEHQALARAILGQMAAETGYDFSNNVDVCGGNMWIWHRKMTKENEGLKLIKSGSVSIKIPPNWRDHIKVIVGKRRKNLPQIIESEEQLDRTFMELCGQYIREPLDNDHKKLIDYLKQIDAVWWWDQDNYMLVTHTIHIKEAHEHLNLRGIFNTTSGHTSSHNCFCFPLRRGGWVVRRFTPGVKEHESWDQDGSGWTRSYVNVDPTLSTVSRNFDGTEHPSGGYMFREAENAQRAALVLGTDLDLPPWAMGRPTKLKAHKDNRLVAEVDKEPTDNPEKMKGWIADGRKWKRIFNTFVSNQLDSPDQRSYDDFIRHITTEDAIDCGWVVKSDSIWVEEPLTHVKLALRSLGLADKDTSVVLGDNIFKRWTIVNKPFQVEYPGDRQWNRNACQFSYIPSKEDKLHYPTWKSILTHVGQSLTPALKDFPWAKDNGIITGYDYLKCWIASVFQHPHEPLPYLFLFGPESSGKSIFHEALSLLITSDGYKDGKTALQSQQTFNGELKGAILCFIEEINLSQRNSVAYTRIKEWVTGTMLNVHPKGGTPYLVKNSTHWIQCGNDISYCPIFPGDTRITVIHVGPIDKDKWENKSDIFIKLKKEAPDFLGEVLKLELPKSTDRLNIPVLSTSEKILIQKQNQDALEEFLSEHCFHAPGYRIKLSEFYDKFMYWLDGTEMQNWNIRKIGRALQLPFVKGRSIQDSQFYIGNISFEKPTEERTPYTVIDNKLIG